MAQVSIVTAARAAAESEQQAAADAMVVLNPSAREFLPWWRLGCAVKKALSVDAPEFVMAARGQPPALSVDAPEFVMAARGQPPALSVDAPEFVMAAGEPAEAATIVGAGDSNATAESKVGKARKNRPRKFLSRWQNAVKRTIFVKYIDHIVTEQMLAALFGTYGTVVDCRICGDPNGLRFAFVEFQCQEEAHSAFLLDGAIIGLTPVKVAPSRTAICPINPMFLPQSEAEWELCARTVYCTNISKIVRSSNLKSFCEAYFGKVCRIKFMDNDKRRTNLAFVEFAEVDGAIAAMESTGIFTGGLRMRICPSKTPIRSHDCYGSSSPELAGSLVETNQAAPPELVPVNGVSTIYSDYIAN